MMKSIFLLFSATAVVAQLSAVPQCAQAYFAQAAHISGCVNSKSFLDLACACTSSSILNYPSSTSYRDTAVSYVRRGKQNTSCSTEDWMLLLTALKNMCETDDGSPKFYCGIPSGSPIPHTKTTRIAPTGSRIATITGEKYTSTRTLSLYPSSTFSYRITTLYTTNTFTSIESGSTSVITTRSINYVASCYTAYVITQPTTISRVTVTASSTRLTVTAVPRTTVTASAKTVTKTATDYSNELWDKISSAEVSRVTITPSTSQSLPTVTRTLSNSSSTSGAGASGVPTSTAPTVAPLATTASSSGGKVGVMSLGLVGVLGIMFVFA